MWYLPYFRAAVASKRSFIQLNVFFCCWSHSQLGCLREAISSWKKKQSLTACAQTYLIRWKADGNQQSRSLWSATVPSILYAVIGILYASANTLKISYELPGYQSMHCGHVSQCNLRLNSWKYRTLNWCEYIVIVDNLINYSDSNASL